MTTARKAGLGSTLRAALLLSAVALPLVLFAQTRTEATDAAPHDGIWHVATEPETGPCAKRHNFKLAVEDGRIRYAGLWPVNASGEVDAVGSITIRVTRGGETLSANGLVRGETASGAWVSPEKNCTGSWVARKA